VRTPSDEPPDDVGDPTPSEPREEEVNPEWPDPMPTESQVIASVAKAEYDRMDEAEQNAVATRWATLPEWRKDEIRDGVEFDLL
jgi:hypothetical protein